MRPPIWDTRRATMRRPTRWPRRSGSSRSSRACCASAAWTTPTPPARFLNPSIDHLHDPMALADMRVAVDRSARRHRPPRADRHPRRLRRRRHHLDGHPAPRARAARRRRRPLHPGAPARRLWPAAGRDRTAARRRRGAGRLGGLRHPRRRGGAPRARARASISIITDHHEPDTELPPALRGRSTRSGRDCRYPDKNLAGVGVALKLVQALVHARRTRAAGCPASSRSRPSARWPTSCRSSARTASSPSSASTC